MSRLAERLAPQMFGDNSFNRPRDVERLGRQLIRVRDLTADGRWRTLKEIAQATNSPEASVSARLRDLRAHGYSVDREAVEGERGLFRYRVSV